MHAARFSLATLVLAALSASIVPAAAQAMTVDEFRRELVGVPLCGTPETGPLAGKALAGDAGIGEFFRVFVAYAVITVALVLHAWQAARAAREAAKL